MTPKQERFAREYLIDLNGTQAAIRAGYAVSGAHTEAHRLLEDPEVKAMVEQGQKALQERAEVTQEYVVRELKEIVRRCTTGTVYNPKAATKALELLGKHLGMFKEDGPTTLIQNNVNGEHHFTRITRRIVDPHEIEADEDR